MLLSASHEQTRAFATLILLCLTVYLSGCQFVQTGVVQKNTEIDKENPMKTRILLVHGLFRTQRAMKPLHRPLEEAGYEVLDYRYYTTQLDVESHVQDLRKTLLEMQAENQGRPLMVVGHSLGAVISVLATTPRIEGIQRVVQIAPPNFGSPVADLFDSLLGRFVVPLKELSTEAGGPLPEGIIPATPTGVIAAENDPMVPISCTRLPGAVDHIQVPGAHTFVFWKSKTQEELIHFLEHGRFSNTAQRVDFDN